MVVQAARPLAVVQAAWSWALSQRPGDADCTSGGSPGPVEQERPLVEVVQLLVE